MKIILITDNDLSIFLTCTDASRLPVVFERISNCIRYIVEKLILASANKMSVN